MNVPVFFPTIPNFFLVYISYPYSIFFWLTWYPILIDIKYFVIIGFNDAISV